MTDSDHLSVKRSALNVGRSASSAAVDTENPWPGLESFTEDARSFFFGREKETDELCRLVRRQTLTVLFGQSGLGKSSLLQAGLFPILREGDHLPLYLRLDHAPGTTPLDAQVKHSLNAAFSAAKADAPAFSDAETLWEYFHRKDNDIWSARNRLLTPVLVFDQFEEIFTLGRTDATCRERSRAFLDELACLVENRPPAAVKARLDSGSLDPARFNFEKPSCQVILSLREDFLPDLESLKQEMPALIHNRLRLKKLNGTQALEVVTRPAPHLLADGVAERIVEFVAGARGGSAERLAELDVEPPLLSVICRELNERRRANGAAQITADLVSGNRREILNDFYERSVGDLPEEMRRFVEDRLLTKSGFRDNLALETALEAPGVTRPSLDTLVARRLVRIEDRLGVQRVELTHDVLAEVIRASRDVRQQRLLLAADRRHTRRQRLAITALVATVLALSVGTFVALRAQRRSADGAAQLAAKRASQTDLILASRLLGEGKAADGLAYLVRAARRDPENALLAPRLLTTLVGRNFLLPEGAPLALPSPAYASHFSSDGRRLFIMGEDRVPRMIDTATWQVVREFNTGAARAAGDPPFVFAEKNDRIFAVSFEDGSLVVFDAETGRPRSPPIRPKGVSLADRLDPVLSPDGRWLAASNNNTTTWIWDAETGEQRATFRTVSESKGFSPDGRLFFSTESDGIGGLGVQIRSIPEGNPVGGMIAASTNGGVSASILPDGRSLLVGNLVRGTQVFDLASGAAVGPAFNLTVRPANVRFTPDGRRAIMTTSRAVNVIDLATGKPVFPQLVHGGTILQPELSADGKLLLTSCVDGLARLWDMDTGALVAEPTLQQAGFAPASLSPDGSHVVIFSNAGPAHRLRVGRSAAQPLRLPSPSLNTIRATFMAAAPSRVYRFINDRAMALDVASGREVAGGFAYPGGQMLTGGSNVRTMLTADQRVLIARTGGSDSRTNAWHIWTRDASDHVVRDVVLEGAQAGFATTSTSVDPTGTQLAASSQFNSVAGIWSLETGKRIVTLTRDSTIEDGVRFSHDGKWLVLRTADKVVHVADYPGDKDRFVLKLSGRAGLSSHGLSLDDQRIVTGDDLGGVQFWDAGTGRLICAATRHREGPVRFSFSSDGRLVVSCSVDGTAQVWEVATGAPVGESLEHGAGVSEAVFSPDGRRVATGTLDGEVRLWDVATSQPITERVRDGASARTGENLEFSPDGRFLLSSRGDRAIYRVRSTPPDGGGATAPAWLLRLATLCASKRLNDDGEFVSAADEVAKIDDVRREIAALPDDAPFVEWGRWFLADRATRSIAPGFTITPSEAEKLSAEMAKERSTPPQPPAP